MGKPIGRRFAVAFVAVGSAAVTALVGGLVVETAALPLMAVVGLLSLLAITTAVEALALVFVRPGIPDRPPVPPGLLFVGTVTTAFGLVVLFFGSWALYVLLWASLWRFAWLHVPLPASAQILAGLLLAWVGVVVLRVRWIGAGPALVRREPRGWSRAFHASLGLLVASAVGLSSSGMPFPKVPDPLVAGLASGVIVYIVAVRSMVHVPSRNAPARA